MVSLNRQKKALIAPLDWGLGHTTRSISIINILLDQNYAVVVACTPNQSKIFGTFLQKIEVLPLFGYNVKYSKKKWQLPFVLAAQFPKIGRIIQKENKWLQQIIEEKKIDLVISDNRFGLYSTKIPCVFITHQLKIKAPFTWAEGLLQKINYHFINKFSQVWIPDLQGKNALAGDLSNPKNLPKIPAHYIGHLNRFFLHEDENNNIEGDIILPNSVDVLILLSGPEPQRSILENLICNQIPQLPNLQFVLLRGLPNNNKPQLLDLNNTVVYHHLPQNKIKELIKKANLIITRSGYTTVMEVLSMKKRCIFIPTPGQTEQEYLANYLLEKQFCICSKQQNFNLQEAIQKATHFNYQFTETIQPNKLIIKALSDLSL